MNKISQKQFVINRLLKNNSISRNEALSNYISRLGALVDKLKSEGWILEGQYERTEKGKDFVYYLRHTPYKKEEFISPIDGHIITQYKKLSPV